MSFLTKVNDVRRAVMREMTRNLGKADLNLPANVNTPEKIQRVLISRPNHRLGNLLLITPLIQEVADTMPGVKIDLFVGGNIGSVLFKNYQPIDRIIQLPKKPFKDPIRYAKGLVSLKRRRYDIAINVVFNSSSGKLAVQFANAKYRFPCEITDEMKLKFADYDHMAKFPVYSFRNYAAKLGFPESSKPVPDLDLRLSAAEIQEGKKTLDGLIHNDKKTICLYTFATGVKCHSAEWWEEFYALLKNQYPQYNIVELLPIENVSQISFKAPSFYSKDLRLIGSFIANTSVFVGADSGMMHLASASKTPTIGLFKKVNIGTYAPYNENSAGINTNDMGMDGVMKSVDNVLKRPD
jgi:ADP-heptose:LPS heptosyltransferase